MCRRPAGRLPYVSSRQLDAHTGQQRRARFEDDENESLPGPNSGFMLNDEDGPEAAFDDSTDGMRAIIFADEEDSAFFGEF